PVPVSAAARIGRCGLVAAARDQRSAAPHANADHGTARLRCRRREDESRPPRAARSMETACAWPLRFRAFVLDPSSLRCLAAYCVRQELVRAHGVGKSDARELAIRFLR